MAEFEKEEFWKALGRLYGASENLPAISQSHEHRLDHLEVVQQWLAEKERRRENEESR